MFCEDQSDLGIFQSLSIEERRQQLSDPKFLPRKAQLESAFINDERENDYDAWIKYACQTRLLSLHDFLTSEYINSLSNYLSFRAQELGAKPQRPLTILEVGAGNGRLAHFLRERLKPDSITYVASDSGKSKIKHLFPYEQMAASTDYQTALQKFNPDIVICEWMPSSAEWTVNFRKTPSVKEYILIGEVQAGSGDSWATWGFAAFDDHAHKNAIPLFTKDGFGRVDFTGEEWELPCRTDESPNMSYHSKTVSFQRYPTFFHTLIECSRYKAKNYFRRLKIKLLYRY